MRRLLPLLIAAVLLSVTAALPAAFGQDDSTASGYTVRGSAVDSVTGQGVARALVSLSQDQAALTDSNGQFSFAAIPAGSYTVSVTKPGYRSVGTAARGFMQAGAAPSSAKPLPPIRIQVGPGMPAVKLAIEPLSTIVGHIALSTADAPDGMRVQVFCRELRDGHPQWQIAGQVRVRDDGSFRVGDLLPGRYRVATLPLLDRPGLALDSHGPVWGYPSLYYPGTTDISAAGVLDLGPGQQAEADITVTRQRFFPVTTVVHSSETTFASFEILDSGGRPSGLPANFDRREGLVHSIAPNGSWTMEAHAYGRTPAWGSAPFQVNSAPATFSLDLLPVPHIPVVIRREFTASSDGSSSFPANLSVNLTPVPADTTGPNLAAGGGMNRTNSTDSGWELDVSRPGRYWIVARPEPPAYISSIASGNVDLGSSPLVVLPASPPLPIEVTLRNDGGSLTGTIDTQTPGANPDASGEDRAIWVYAIPLFSTAAPLRNAMPTPDGHFTLNNLAPGSYRVVACDAPQEVDFHSQDGLAAWAGKGQTVTVEPGGTASAELQVLHLGAEPEP